MRILLTGGGSGGHFYPIIAVIEAIYDLVKEKKLLSPQLIFMSDSPYDEKLIKKEGVLFKKVYAGKLRRYPSIFNITDFFKSIFGVVKAFGMVYSFMPDVVFGKGGYVSFPALLAARVFKIPVIIHESDSVPGRVNQWAGKFAKRIAISFAEAAEYFPNDKKDKIALTGTPVRKTILGYTPDEGREVFGLEKDLPVVLVLGGSQGAQKLNETFLDVAGEVVKSMQIIHQCGSKNYNENKARLSVVMEENLFENRYHLYPFLNNGLLRNAASVADLIVSRAGSSAIFEIALWGLPSILIPLENSAQDHQRQNAYNYARTGAACVIEQPNLTPHILLSEIERLLEDKETLRKMKEAAKSFSKPNAARTIAQEIINLGLEHL
jgi:UDP-N-acetylglucosamine--N-acetylmuramyl-(pentapeptide) pyrophosphoryl-undecaprenol N-acetylglucosamine transferase